MKNMKIFKHSVRFYILSVLLLTCSMFYINNSFGLVDKIIDTIENPKVEIQYKFIYIDVDKYHSFHYGNE